MSRTRKYMHGNRRRISSPLLDIPTVKELGTSETKSTSEKQKKITFDIPKQEFKPSLITTGSISIMPSSTTIGKDIRKVLPIGTEVDLSAIYNPTEALSISGEVHSSPSSRGAGLDIMYQPTKTLSISGAAHASTTKTPEGSVSIEGGGINLTKKFKKFSLFGAAKYEKGSKPYYEGGISLNI